MSVVGSYDTDWIGNPLDQCSFSHYCIFVGGNLVTWHSKEQRVVARLRPSTKLWHLLPIIWIQFLLSEMGVAFP